MSKARYVVVESNSLRTVIERVGGTRRGTARPASPTAARQFAEAKREASLLKRQRRKRSR